MLYISRFLNSILLLLLSQPKKFNTNTIALVCLLFPNLDHLWSLNFSKSTWLTPFRYLWEYFPLVLHQISISFHWSDHKSHSVYACYQYYNAVTQTTLCCSTGRKSLWVPRANTWIRRTSCSCYAKPHALSTQPFPHQNPVSCHEGIRCQTSVRALTAIVHSFNSSHCAALPEQFHWGDYQ